MQSQTVLVESTSAGSVPFRDVEDPYSTDLVSNGCFSLLVVEVLTSLVPTGGRFYHERPI